MQTLEPRPDLDEASISAQPAPKRGRNAVAFGAAIVAVVVAAAGIAYAVGASQSNTTTVVKTVAPPPAAPVKPAATKPATPACVPGAAKGSCNIDEASEINIPDKPLDAATRAQLQAEQLVARAAAMKYPTVADAEKAGMILAGGFSPLTGAHFINISGAVGGTFNPANPGSYIYDGTSPTSKIIGLMYLSGDLNPPEGFAGPNDHWHRHTNTCVQFDGGEIKVPFPADSSVTKAQCDAVHGTFMRRTTWMVHDWVVPGWESPAGVFAHDNPDVICADGTTHADARGFCQGT